MRQALGLIALASCLFTSADAPAEDPSYRESRYCLNPDSSDRWKRSRHRIYVRLHESLSEICSSDPMSCSAVDQQTARFQLENAVKTALASFDNGSGADIRFIFDGWTRHSGYRDDVIVLAHFSEFGSGSACPEDYRAMANHKRQSWWRGSDDQGIVYFCTENDTDGDFTWSAWEGYAPFIPVVRHELLHVLGLKHSLNDGCILDADATNATLMRPVTFTMKSLGREDIRFLRDHFGVRSNDARSVTSVDGLAWSQTQSQPPTQTHESIGRPAATNSQGGADQFIAWRESESSLGVARLSEGDDWTFLASVPASDAPYFPGIGYAHDRNLVLAYQRHFPGLGSSEMYLVMRVSVDGGKTWSNEISRRDAISNRPGIYVTHDPVTDDWLFLMTTRRGRIQYVTLRPGDKRNALPGDWSTPDVASAACGDPEKTGPYNCLISWQTSEWASAVEWSQCRLIVDLEDVSSEVSTGEASRKGEVTLDCLPKREHNYLTVASAPVAYIGDRSNFTWRLGLSQGGAGVFTWRKGPGLTPWADESSIYYTPRALIPAVGSRQSNDGTQAVITIFND